MEKRGLSTILSAVLFILLGLAAVVLLWIIIRGVTSPIEDIQGQIDITLRNEKYVIVPSSVHFRTSGDSKLVEMNIKRKSNSPSAIAFYLIMEDNQGSSVTHRVNTTLAEFEEKKVTVDYTGDTLATLHRLILVPIFSTSKGKEITPSLSLIPKAQDNPQVSSLAGPNNKAPGESYIYVFLPGAECTDGVDNDGDGFIDTVDYGCIASGVTEWVDYKFQCADGIDNNGNGLVDMLDPNCLSPYDDFEGTVSPQKYAADEDMLLPVSFPTACDGEVAHCVVKNGATTLADLQILMGTTTGLEVTKKFITRPGGVDINIVLKNPTGSPINHPDFTLYGIKHKTSGPANFIGGAGAGYLPFVIDNPSTYYGGNFVWVGVYTVADVYSPISIVDDGTFASGVALEFPYLEYGYDPTFGVYIDSVGTPTGIDPNGYWSVRFMNFVQTANLTHYGGTINRTDIRGNISAGAIRNYTISVRFSSPRNAIFTALPYKRYFESLYGPRTGTVSDRDRRPVRADIMADSIYHINNDFSLPIDQALLRDNPRRYISSFRSPEIGRVDKYGWGPLVDYWIAESQSKGYKRYMVWAAGGLYENEDFNYPPHMQSFWLPNVSNSAANLSRMGQSGISLGFWWGRTLQVPFPDQWEPPTLQYLDFSRRAHQQFVKRELSLALSRGTTELGLDAFKAVPIQRYLYLKTIKMLAPSIRSTQEVYTSDIFNGDADVWMGPELYTEADMPKSPAILASYLNPSASLWYRIHDDRLVGGVQARVDQGRRLMEMGYTPVFVNNVPDIRSITQPNLPAILQCYDGKDNDGDGKIDLYDSGCDNMTDRSEN
ncbi:hypothetical protein KW805_01230 [Candidatus Pacearchaeota archaeon]|nr:hypothetical protein [Candidatus Pacearchaeota archaeon]